MREETDSSAPEPKFLQCPYLGTLKERNSFVNSPSHANFCYKSDPAAYPSNALQKKICLTPLFAECPVYIKPDKGRIPDDLQWKSPLARLKGLLQYGLIPLAAVGFIFLIFLVGNKSNWWKSLPLVIKAPEPTATASLPTQTPIALATQSSSALVIGTSSGVPSTTATPTLTPTPGDVPFFLRLFPPKMTPTPSATPPSSSTLVTFEAGPYFYRGTPFRATAAVTGVGGLNEPVGVAYSGDCTNVSTQGCTATAVYSGDLKHAASSDSKRIMILPAKSTTTVTFEAGPYVYRGTQFRATAVATGVGGLNAPVNITYANCTNVSTAGCTATATFPGDTNHASSVGSANIAITTAPSTTVVVFEAGPYVYRGTAFTATAVATGAGGLSAPASVTYTDCTNAAAGCTAIGTYAGDVNHGGSIASSSITITKAASTTVVTFEAGPYVYRASAFTATAVATGAGGLNLPLTVTYAGSCTNVGAACTATATYPDTLNYIHSSDTKSITITQAQSTTVVTFEPSPYTYRGTAFTATAFATGAGGLNLPLTVTYVGSCINVTITNGCTATATYSNPNYFGSTDTKSITISRAPVTVQAGSFSGIYDGNTHSPSACMVAGDYTIGLSCTNDPASVGPNVGQGSVNLILAGNIGNFDLTYKYGFWSISQAPVTMTAGGTAGTYNGVAHDPSKCSVTGSYIGELTCGNNPDSVGPNVGSGSVVPVLHTNGETSGNFVVNPVNGSWLISQAPVTMTAGGTTRTYNGVAHDPSACAVTGTYTGALSCTNSPSSVGPNVGSGSVNPQISLNGESLANFAVSPVSNLWSITPAPVTLTASGYSGTYDGAAHSLSACAVTGGYTGGLSCTNNPASVGPNVGSGSVNPQISLNGESSTNFSVSPVNNSWSITPAQVTITAGGYKETFDGNTHSPSPCTVSGGYTGPLTCTNDPDTVGPEVGSGDVSPVLDYHGDSAGNYSVTSVDGSWEITESPLAPIRTYAAVPYLFTANHLWPLSGLHAWAEPLVSWIWRTVAIPRA